VPKELERKLKSQARKKFGSITSPKARKFIFGIMRRTGWKPSKQR